MAADFGLDFQGFSQQAAWLDYDQDGDIYMYVLNHSVHSPETFVMADKRTKRDSMPGDVLFRNDDGKFVDVSESAGIYGGAMGFGLGISIGDLNGNVVIFMAAIQVLGKWMRDLVMLNSLSKRMNVL